jgi:hypothetical protein
MADFRMKLFVLAGMATVFAGLASAQTSCTAATANAVFVRSESNDDQVADTTITCSTLGGTAAGTISLTVYLSPSVNITSAVVNKNSEAMAGLTASFPTGGGAPWVNATNVSGNQATFSNIATVACAAVAPASCAAFTVTITNIKVASSTVATGSGVPTGISETIFVSGTNTTPTALTTGSAVAYVTAGLGGVKSDKTNANPLCNSTTAWGSGNGGYTDSAGNKVSVPAGDNGAPNAFPNNFIVIFGEAFPNSFRTQGSATVAQQTGVNTPGGAAANLALGAWATNHTETGTGYVSGGLTNQATSGTRVKIIFNNIPANVTLYVPTTFGGPSALVQSASANGAVLTLTASETGSYSPVAASTSTSAPGSTDGKTNPPTAYAAPLTVTSGSATAIYELTTTSSSPAVFTIPVFLGASSGAVTAPTSAITATVSLAPIGATSNVPNFINGASTTTVNGSNFVACSTTLLFPFVTNQAGFESGIAISNTGADLLGVKSGAPISSVTGQSGTCVLTFFGNATASSNPPAFTTAAAVVPGTTWTGTLTSVTGGTPGTFGGYMIANCNFLFGHGFTYITYNIGQSNAMAEGYLALELTQATRGGNSSTAALAATNESLNN